MPNPDEVEKMIQGMSQQANEFFRDMTQPKSPETETLETSIFKVKHSVDSVIKLCRFSLKLIETLQFYADPMNYHAAVGRPDILIDGGQRARDVLEERL